MLDEPAEVFEAHVAAEVSVHDFELYPSAAVAATLNALHHQCRLDLLELDIGRFWVISCLNCAKLQESDIFGILIVILLLFAWFERLRT